MPTVNQMVRKGRKNSKTKSKAPALQFTLNSFKQRRVRQDKGAPQKRGVCLFCRDLVQFFVNMFYKIKLGLHNVCCHHTAAAADNGIALEGRAE